MENKIIMVKVEEKVHKDLFKLKGHNGCNSLNEVIKFLIKFYQVSK